MAVLLQQRLAQPLALGIGVSNGFYWYGQEDS